MGALYGPVDSPGGPGEGRDPNGVAVLGLPGLVLGQLRQRYRLHGRFFCALSQVLGLLGA